MEKKIFLQRAIYHHTYNCKLQVKLAVQENLDSRICFMISFFYVEFAYISIFDSKFDFNIENLLKHDIRERKEIKKCHQLVMKVLIGAKKPAN